MKDSQNTLGSGLKTTIGPIIPFGDNPIDRSPTIYYTTPYGDPRGMQLQREAFMLNIQLVYMFAKGSLPKRYCFQVNTSPIEPDNPSTKWKHYMVLREHTG